MKKTKKTIQSVAIQSGKIIGRALALTFTFAFQWAVIIGRALHSLVASPSKPHTLGADTLESKFGSAWYGIHLSSAFILIRGDNNVLNSNNVEWTLGINYPDFINNINLNTFYNFLTSWSTNNAGQLGAINRGVPDYNFNTPGFIGNILREVSSLEINTGLMGIYNGLNITHIYIVPLALLAPVIVYPLLPYLTKFIDNFFTYSTKLSINLIKNLVKSLPFGFKAIKLSGINTSYLNPQSLENKPKDWGFKRSFSWVRSKILPVIPDYLRNIQVYMAQCAHSWKFIGSGTTLVHWRCSGCSVGPFFAIWECIYCKIKRCDNCTQKR